MHAKLTLLLTNSMQTKQQISFNDNLKKISLPQLTTTTNNLFFVRHDPSPLLYTALSLSLTIYPSLHPYRFLAIQSSRSCAHPSLKMEVRCASATTATNHSSTRTSASWWMDPSLRWILIAMELAMPPPCAEIMVLTVSSPQMDARRMHAADE